MVNFCCIVFARGETQVERATTNPIPRRSVAFL